MECQDNKNGFEAEKLYWFNLTLKNNLELDNLHIFNQNRNTEEYNPIRC